MFEFLNSVDSDLFLLINGCHNSFFDSVMTYASSKFFWVWFYLILLYFIIRKYHWRSVLVLIFVALLIALSDQLSVHLFKNTFQRLRPCHSEELVLLVHTVSGCGGQYGFVSSHAANSFALAFFIGGLMWSNHKWILLTLLIWATFVGYSRIYLGVHYPGDIIGGAVLGMILGYLILQLYNYSEKKFIRNTNNAG